MGSGAFGWLAFGWYTIPLGEVTPPVELVGVGGSATLTPNPGGAVTRVTGGALSFQGPGGSLKLKP